MRFASCIRLTDGTAGEGGAVGSTAAGLTRWAADGRATRCESITRNVRADEIDNSRAVDAARVAPPRGGESYGRMMMALSRHGPIATSDRLVIRRLCPMRFSLRRRISCTEIPTCFAIIITIIIAIIRSRAVVKGPPRLQESRDGTD